MGGLGWHGGDRLLDLYDVLDVVHSGGMGRVHRVRHLTWQIDLAGKTPRPEVVATPAGRSPFEAEAGTWVGLNLHAHVVGCVYVRRIGETPCVFAEWVNGGSLATAVRDGRLYLDSLAGILDIAIQAAWGIGHAHEQGIVHQDVKPADDHRLLSAAITRVLQLWELDWDYESEAARVTVTISVHDRGSVREHPYRGRATCVLGRGDDCGIRIAHAPVSRRHCQLEIDPPQAWIRDLESRNGTYVNGTRIDGLTDRMLADGDEIRFGGVRDVVLRVAIDPAPTAGSALPEAFSDYELIRELGRGAQGVVHLARHTSSGELVALKVMLAHGSVDENARFAFLREYESIRALRHPHIVEFRGSAMSGNEFCFTCEYCPGGSLDQLVARRGGRLPLDEALPITLQVLDGLRYAHGAQVPVVGDGTVTSASGLVHRDVKPHNVLLTGPADRPTAKLADFGLAKAFEHAGLSGYTRTGALGGSIPFVPRTQLIGYRQAGPEVDVWAVAACLYWMLTGATPRDFPPDTDPVAVGLREPVVPVQKRLPSIGARLAEVIDEALVDRPAHSITSADELARALRAVS